jgi:hypothetical protein
MKKKKKAHRDLQDMKLLELRVREFLEACEEARLGAHQMAVHNQELMLRNERTPWLFCKINHYWGD